MASASAPKRLWASLTEEEVRELVDEACHDLDDCLISPIWAYINTNAVQRHRRRVMRIMGLGTRAVSFVKSWGLVGAVFAAITTALLFNQEMPWYLDIVFSTILTLLLFQIVKIHQYYREAFCHIIVNERADFTDPSQVTAQLHAWIPRLAYYYSPEVWKGSNDHNSITNPGSMVVVKTEDVVVWLPDGGVDVTPAKQVTEFRTQTDYLNLPADRFNKSGAASRARRALLRTIQRNAIDTVRYNKGATGLLDGKWEWLFCGACLLAIVLILGFQS